MTEENIFDTQNSEEVPVEENISQNGTEAAEDTTETGNMKTESAENPVKPFFVYENPALKEKAEIKRASKIIGSAFILLTGVVLLLNAAILIVAAIIKKSAADALQVIWEPAVLQAQQILFSLLAFTVPFTVIFKLGNIRISSLMSFSPPKKKTALPFFLFGIAFCAFANVAASFAESIFSNSKIGYEVNMPKSPAGLWGLILSLISTVAVPALVEEFACRGVILGYLRKFGEGFAVIASAVLFGLMHGNFEQMPFAFLVGLVLGFITVKSGTLLIAISVHAFNNLISVLLDYFFADVPNIIKNVGYTVFLMICMLLGIVAVFLFARNEDNSLYKFDRGSMQTSEKEKFKWFFTSVPMIIFIIVCIIESLQYFVF